MSASGLIEQIKRWEDAQSALKATISEANSTMKSLRNEKRDTERVLRESQQAADRARAAAEAATDEQWKTYVAGMMPRLERLAEEAIARHRESATARTERIEKEVHDVAQALLAHLGAARSELVATAELGVTIAEKQDELARLKRLTGERS